MKRRSIVKKLASLLLAFLLVISLCVPAFADVNETQTNETFCIDNYTQYTISFSPVAALSAASTADTAPTDTIDAAISYVKSLGLSDMGYSHIEEACLNELEGYREDGVTLVDYTVLVPKARTKSYYGTYLNHDFYYEYTSSANIRRETKGDPKSSTNEVQWDKWIAGAMDLVMCFVPNIWGVPYTLVRTVTGVSTISSVHYGSYNQYVEQFTNIQTRTIFRKANNKYTSCYQDQTCSLRVNMYFCPVGTDFQSDYYNIGTVFSGSIQASQLTKNQILSSANAYANRNSMLRYSVTFYRVTEKWNG